EQEGIFCLGYKVGIDSKGFFEFFDCPGSRQGVEDLREVSNDDTAVAQRRLKDKQPEEKTNTDCLVKEQEKEYHTRWKIKMGNVLDSYNQSYREDSNEAAFAVAAVEKIYARESLTFNNTVACEVISKWKAGLKDNIDTQSDVYVLSNGCKKCSDDSDGYYRGCKAEILATKGLLDKAKGNVLGIEIVRDQSGYTLRGTMICKYFQAHTRTEIQQFRDTLIQHMESLWESIQERAKHKREYDRMMNDRMMQSIEGNADSSKALDDGLVVTKSNETELERHILSSRSGNDTHTDDADINFVNDKQPMAEVQLSAAHNILANELQHFEQSASVYAHICWKMLIEIPLLNQQI
nr:zinc finger, CCHC-type [Tanacetum cinerariifolium]